MTDTARPATWQALDPERVLGIAIPTDIRFGAGTRSAVGGVAAGLGQQVALVVGRSWSANPPAVEIEGLLAAAGLPIAERIVVAGEPDDTAVLAAADRVARLPGVVLVAVGGGSVLDLAKAAAVVAVDPDRLERVLSGERIDRPDGRPVVALPTTAGSGAEASHGAIVLHRRARRKRGLRGPGVAARAAIVDPELMVSAPAGVTAASGFDAVAHAIETAVSRASSPIVQALSAEALPRLLAHVPRAMTSPGDLASRVESAYAAMLMGLNLALSSTCLPHRLQYPLGAATGTSHAIGVAALTPAWLERTLAHAPAGLALLARRSGVASASDADEAAARALADRLLGLLEELGLRRGLRDLGVGERDLPDLVAAVEGTLANDPGPTTPADLLDLYRASL